MELGKVMDKIQELEGGVALPFDIKRALPSLTLFGSQICFSQDGDYLTRQEAYEVVSWLKKQLKED